MIGRIWRWLAMGKAIDLSKARFPTRERRPPVWGPKGESTAQQLKALPEVKK